MSDRTPAADVTKVLLSLAAGPLALGMVLLLVVVAFVGVCGPTGKPSLHVALDTVRITDSIEVQKWDTITVYLKPAADRAKAKSDTADRAVTITSDSTVSVTDSANSYAGPAIVYRIPPPVIHDLALNRRTVAAQDTLIRALYQHDTTQQWRIATRDQLIQQLNRQAHPICGRRCGVVLGLTAGILIHRALK